MQAVIVVYGGSGQGKDVLSDMIAEALDPTCRRDPVESRVQGESVLRCAFADPLKQIAQILGMPREVAYGSQEVKLKWVRWGLTGRQILQILGTEWARKTMGAGIWVDALADMLHKQPPRVKFAIASDGRFMSERELDKRLPGVPVHKVLIWRPSAPDLGLPPTLGNRIKARLSSLPVVRHVLGLLGIRPLRLMHASEAEVWDMRQRMQRGEQLFDDFVVNDGTLEDLRAKARQIAKTVLGTQEE